MPSYLSVNSVFPLDSPRTNTSPFPSRAREKAPSDPLGMPLENDTGPQTSDPSEALRRESTIPVPFGRVPIQIGSPFAASFRSTGEPHRSSGISIGPQRTEPVAPRYLTSTCRSDPSRYSRPSEMTSLLASAATRIAVADLTAGGRSSGPRIISPVTLE